jgi:hypothetical protein
MITWNTEFLCLLDKPVIFQKCFWKALDHLRTWIESKAINLRFSAKSYFLRGSQNNRQRPIPPEYLRTYSDSRYRKLDLKLTLRSQTKNPHLVLTNWIENLTSLFGSGIAHLMDSNERIFLTLLRLSCVEEPKKKYRFWHSPPHLPQAHPCQCGPSGDSGDSWRWCSGEDRCDTGDGGDSGDREWR